MAAVFASDAGKSVVKIAAIQIAVYHLLDIRPPMGVFLFLNGREKSGTNAHIHLDGKIIVVC